MLNQWMGSLKFTTALLGENRRLSEAVLTIILGNKSCGEVRQYDPPDNLTVYC